MLTTGPMSEDSSLYGPTLILFILGVIFSISLSAESPMATATDIAIHLSPAEPNAAPIKASDACSISASGMTSI